MSDPTPFSRSLSVTGTRPECENAHYIVLVNPDWLRGNALRRNWWQLHLNAGSSSGGRIAATKRRRPGAPL